MKEIWKAIQGYEGYYEVSNLGNVRSVDRVVPHKVSGYVRLKGKVVAKKSHKDGYEVVTLHKNSHRRNRMVHQLVLETFDRFGLDGEETRHLNGIPNDNRLENLAWGTPVENAADKKIHGTEPWGKRTHCKNGHDITNPENVRMENGARVCRTCVRERRRKNYALNNKWRATVNGEKAHCPQGHEYTPENTMRGSSDRKHRKCKTCHRERARARRANMKKSGNTRRT